jgi:hypothetical protein
MVVADVEVESWEEVVVIARCTGAVMEVRAVIR